MKKKMAMEELECERVRRPGCSLIPKTKIICTLGPKSRDVGMLERLLRAGMSVARFNFSHGSHAYHQETLQNLQKAMQNTQSLCAVMLDTKGPEIRTGLLKGGKPVQLNQGQEIIISTDYSLEGDANMISMSYKKLPEDVKPGSLILCSDGTITLTVLSCDTVHGLVKCRCENTTMLGEKKNVNLPGVIVDLPTITEKDKDDILNWGIPNKIDFIAASFVRKGQDVVNIKNLLGKHMESIQIISKIENQEGLINFDEILAETDAVMVARGDLGMEIPTEKVFLAQKMIIYKCNAVGKPVVTATQMLESMIKCRRPTRAEVTDVGNAVLDGTDAVMLSGETAAGEFPEDAVHTMSQICLEAEKSLNYGSIYKAFTDQTSSVATVPPMKPLESLALSAVGMASNVNAALILVLSQTGGTAKLVAKYRPPVPILSVVVPVITTNNITWCFSDTYPSRHSLICRGIIPILSECATRGKDSDASEELISSAIAHALKRGLCKQGDAIVALHRIGKSSVVKVVDVRPRTE